MLDDGLGDPLPLRVGKEPAPRSPPRALQIDEGDFTVGRQQATSLDEFRRWDHLPAPKRGLRLSRLTLNNVEMIVPTIRSGWPFARYCARHSCRKRTLTTS